MASGENRVPKVDTEFNTYLNTTTDYLFEVDPVFAFNWTRLGLTATEATQWSDYRTAWNAIYATYATGIEQGNRSKTVTENKNEAKENFTDWVTDPDLNRLDRIGASVNITNEDRNVFHIKKREDNRTTFTAPIAADIFMSIKPHSGGDMRVGCRTTEDASRASIPKDEGAKAVELAYLLGTTPPVAPSACDKHKISSKALFTFNVGDTNVGKKMYCFARWVDTSNDARAGSWSEMVTVLVN